MTADEVRANIEAALQHGVDIDGRRIFLHGDVSEEAIAMAIRGLYLLEGKDAETPIELYVTSYGGTMEDAFALHDVTRTLKPPIHTVALGKCMSAAPLLVACGYRGNRWTTPNTTFMLHDATMESEGFPAQVEQAARLEKDVTERYAWLLARYSKRDRRFWRRIFNSRVDRYFTAEQAVDWGLVDQIWEEK